MVKRKCGTCRHFSDGGVAGSGWCQHPARRDLQHMVLVRKSELACRNGWDQDLWEQGIRPTDPSLSSGSERQLGPGDRQPSFTADMIPDPSAGELGEGEIFTDKIQSIGLSRRPVEQTPGVAAAVPSPMAEGSHQGPGVDSRSVVREARRRRQEQRTEEQRKHQQAMIQEAGKLLEQPGAEDPASQVVPPSVDSTRSSTLGSGSTARSRPPAGDVPSPSPNPETGNRSRKGDDDWVELRGRPGRFGESERSATPPSAPLGRADQGTEPLPIAELQAGTAPEDVPIRESLQRDRRPIFLDPPVQPRPTNWITGAGAIGGDRRRSRLALSAASEEARLPLALSVDPIDEAKAAARFPRCCATCRDFRRVGDGTRGWCVNPHAFTERRMVQSDELSCRSSIGAWWLPSDELWLERVDMTHHGRPTPLLDELFGDEPVEGHDLEARPL